MRDPVLRISQSNLVKILKDVSYVRDAKQYADAIFSAAQPYQIRNRHFINVKNSKVGKKLQKTQEAENPIIEKFNLILYTIRKELNHQRVKTIMKTDREYQMLKEVAQMAYEFSEDFDIKPREEGYKEFCRTGINMMGKQYGLNKFKTYKAHIWEYYESLIVIDRDENDSGTLEFYAEWQRAMLEYTGLENQIYIDREPKKFVHMVYGRQSADEAKADYSVWITAQFEGLAFLNAIPELSQFHGDNALARYERTVRAVTGTHTEEEDKEELHSDDEGLNDYFKTLND